MSRDPAARRRMSKNKELQGYYLEDISLGMTALYTRTITDADIVLFAGISGDHNPLHLDDEFARDSMFEGRVAHGLLTASLISAVLGTKLPGPGAVYISQSLNFRAPVRIGDTVEARATVREIAPEKRRVTLDTVCTVGETVVVDGNAVVMVPSRAGAGST